MQLVIDFYFLSICVLYMFRASSAHHQESLTVHTASSFLELKLCFKWVLNIKIVKIIKYLKDSCAQAVKSPSFYHGSPLRFQTSLCRIHGKRNGSKLRFLWNASVLHRPYHSVIAPYSCICYRKYVILEVDSLILILIFLIILNFCTYYEALQCAVFTWQCGL
jgi:hypothetical protein